MNALETVNSFPGHWFCASNGYIYGIGLRNFTSILRKTESGQAFEVRGNVLSLDSTFRIEYRMFAASIPDLIFILVKNLSGYYLLKSSDGGATLKNVFTFGEGNGVDNSNSADVRVLRGLLELSTDVPGGGGRGTLYIGEYNVNHSRIPGSTNDRVRIMKSVDNGDTWTKVMEWNTNGKNQIGHIHSMKQDPYTGEIYICTGDGNTKSSIIKWDGSSPWADNKTPSELSSMKGFEVFTGAQRFRVCDVLFDEHYFYTFADTQAPNNPTGSESGIWRGTKNFSSYTRVDNQIYDYDPMHIGWFGEKIGNTLIFTTSREYEDSADAWKELNTRIYISTDGEKWYAAGVLNWRDYGNRANSRYINNVFRLNDKLYINCVEGAGHYSTIQCSFNREWKSYEDPVVLHPVYFVGNWNTTGNDANSGTNADNPKKTLKNAMTSNRISAGSRIRIAPGNFQESNINPLWSGAFIQGKGSVIIEGQGMDRTHIIISSGTGNDYGIYLEAAKTLTDVNTPLILRNLNIYMSDDKGFSHTNYILSNADSYIKTSGCRIGDSRNDDSPLIKLGGEGCKYFSENSFHLTAKSPGSYKKIIEADTGNTVIDMKNCIILNAYDAFTIDNPGMNLSLKNCTFYGIERFGVLLNGENNAQPVINNCIFNCATAPICDLSRLTESYIDYNYYNRPNLNVTDGDHNLNSMDPLFADPENFDFNLRSNSPCAMNGIFLSDVSYDFLGRDRSNPSSMGAYESPALTVTPDYITISPSSGAFSEILIRSNISWNISDYDTWLNFSTVSGSGSGIIKIISTSPNNSSEPRVAKVTFSAAGLNPVILSVTQSGEIITKNEEIIRKQLKIYPNPVSDYLTVEYDIDNYSSFSILNSQGKCLIKGKVNSHLQQIDFSKFETGFYILRFVDSRNNVKNIKILKE